MPHRFGKSDNETGVFGKTEGANSAGVAGFYDGTEPTRPIIQKPPPRPPSGVLGVHTGEAAQDTIGSGVRGESGSGDGVVGVTGSPAKSGVFGLNETTHRAEPPGGSGVLGVTKARGGVGVFGANTSNKSGRGVQGNGPEAGVGGFSVAGFGVIGVTNASLLESFDPSNPPTSAGVYGTSNAEGGTAVFGRHDGVDGRGVQGVGKLVGVGGFCEHGAGVVGESKEGAGVRGRSELSLGAMGESQAGVGVKGSGQSGMIAVGTHIGILATNDRSADFSSGDLDGDKAGSNQRCGVFAHGDLPLYLQTTGENFVIGWRHRQGDDDPPNVFRIDKYGTGFFPQLQATGADVAEFFETGNVIDAGSVVEIDPDRLGGLRLCSTAYCTSVAGVLSSAPGVTLGGGEGVTATSRLALAGRVPVKASAENGAIKPGDLLVASSTSGHAMASSLPAKPGTIIGKALGKLDGGLAMIEMLVVLG